ncbi:MAG TPA: hypothetical protein VNA12_03335 [Mycobacteriales bacterium]|nr:hypothetical protein [Mycobacteriales bacterium]
MAESATDGRCGAPVVVPGVFSSVSTDTGHRCARAAGHDGPHRWSATWTTMPPAEVETAVRRAEAAWDDDEDEPEHPTSG